MSVQHRLFGGLAMASVLACMLFAAVSGSSPATVVAIGSIVIVGMVNLGYTRKFAAGAICNAGTLGILISPSIVMVVYAAATETSTGKMFIAGILPGVLLAGVMMLAIYLLARYRKIPRQAWGGWSQVWHTGRRAIWGMSLVIINMDLSPWAFLLVVNVLLLIAGNFMEPSSVILILALIVFPIAMSLGIDPVHLGIIMVVNLEIGMVTPPVGLNLFVTAGVAGMPIEEVIVAALPWLLILISVLIIVTYVPIISLLLPELL